MKELLWSRIFNICCIGWINLEHVFFSKSKGPNLKALGKVKVYPCSGVTLQGLTALFCLGHRKSTFAYLFIYSPEIGRAHV